MKRLRPMLLALFALSILAGPATADTGVEEFSGVVTEADGPKVLTTNTRLVGPVTCLTITKPCIAFGDSHIKLWLNGFSVTGPANPDLSNPGDATFCNPNSGLPAADGILIPSGMTHDQIIGPGIVQKFRRHGISVFGSGPTGVSTKTRIRWVTSHHNCFSGIFFNGVTGSFVEDNASVRNGINSGGIPCGGNCLVNSHNNLIRRNQFSGNGSAAAGNNDFGVGILFGSSGNVVYLNRIGGNTNGIYIHAGTTRNLIRENVILGNPPAQVSRSFGATIGADIKDEALPGSNDFDRNWCITYIGAHVPPPCPSLPGPENDESGR